MTAPGEGEVQSWLQQKVQKAPHQWEQSGRQQGSTHEPQGESQRPQGSTLGQRGCPHGVHAGPTITDTLAMTHCLHTGLSMSHASQLIIVSCW